MQQSSNGSRQVRLLGIRPAISPPLGPAELAALALVSWVVTFWCSTRVAVVYGSVWSILALQVVWTSGPWWRPFVVAGIPAAIVVYWVQSLRRRQFNLAASSAPARVLRGRKGSRTGQRSNESNAIGSIPLVSPQGGAVVVGYLASVLIIGAYIHFSWLRNLGAFEGAVVNLVYESCGTGFVVAGFLGGFIKLTREAKSLRRFARRTMPHLIGLVGITATLMVFSGMRRSELSQRNGVSLLSEESVADAASDGKATSDSELAAGTIDSLARELQSAAPNLREQARSYFIAGHSAYESQLYELAAKNFAQSSSVVPSKSAYLNEGLAWMQGRVLEEAETAFNKGRDLSRNSRDEHFEAYFLNSLAAVYHDLDRLEEEMTAARRAKQICEARTDLRCVALSWHRIGDVLYHQRKYTESLNALSSARSNYSESNKPLEARGVSLDIGNVYIAQGQPREALEAYQTALGAAIEGGDRRTEAKIHRNLGDLYETEKPVVNFAIALEHYKAAYELAKEVNDWRLQIRFIQHVARLSGRMNLASDELEAWKTGLGVAAGADDTEGVGFFYKQLGLLHLSAGRDKEADEALRGSVAAYEYLGQPGLASGVLSNWGGYLIDKGRYLDALAKYRQAIENVRRISDTRGEASLTYEVGMVLKRLNRNDEAEASFKRAISLAGPVSDHWTQALAANSLGYSQKDKGDLTGGIARLNEAISYCHAAGDKDLNQPICRAIRESLEDFRNQQVR